MRHHVRPPLPDQARLDLERRQRELTADLKRRKTPQTRAACLENHWKRFAGRTARSHAVVTLLLKAMASGKIKRCLYCEHDRGSQIDHFAPRSIDASRAIEWSNFVWSCGPCNNAKLASPTTNLIDPSADDPLEHLQLNRTGAFAPVTPRGVETERAFSWVGRNSDLNQGRYDARQGIVELLKRYARCRDNNKPVRAKGYKRRLLDHPFGDVFAALLALEKLPNPAAVLDRYELAALRNCPEAHSWLATSDAERVAAARPRAEALARKIRTR